MKLILGIQKNKTHQQDALSGQTQSVDGQKINSLSLNTLCWVNGTVHLATSSSCPALLNKYLICSPGASVPQVTGFEFFTESKLSRLPGDERTGSRPPKWPFFSPSCTPLHPDGAHLGLRARSSSTCSLLGHYLANNALLCWEASQHEELYSPRVWGDENHGVCVWWELSSHCAALEINPFSKDPSYQTVRPIKTLCKPVCC